MDLSVTNKIMKTEWLFDIFCLSFSVFLIFGVISWESIGLYRSTITVHVVLGACTLRVFPLMKVFAED